MNKILVFSDSHRNTTYMNKVIEKLQNDISMIIHIGDVHDDIKHTRNLFPFIEFCCVLGNCDYGAAVPYDRIISVCGLKIFITHGHKYNVKYDTDRIVYAAMERKASICMFGHTHMPLLSMEEGILFLNPGSISMPRNNVPSYAILNITNGGNISASVIGKFDIGKRIIMSFEHTFAKTE